MAKNILTNKGLLIFSKSEPRVCWGVAENGYLYPISTDSNIFAKGVEERRRAAGQAYEAVASAAAAATCMPSAMLVAPLANYFDELAKAYRGAADVLRRLAKTIETGDDRHMLDNKAHYFNNLAQHLTNAISRGAVRGWAETALGAGAGYAMFGPPRAGYMTMGERSVAGLVDANINIWPQFPIMPELLEAAMDAVTIPIPEEK